LKFNPTSTYRILVKVAKFGVLCQASLKTTNSFVEDERGGLVPIHATMTVFGPFEQFACEQLVSSTATPQMTNL
jgi:hypothetical protein